MHKIIHSASALPPAWKTLAGDNLLLSIPFLKHLEEVQKRQTEYHLFYDKEGKLDSMFIVFVYPDFPFFKNTKLPYTRRINMIYYPLPFSGSTMIIGEKTRDELEKVVQQIKGFTLVCNIPEGDLLNIPYQLSYARCTLDVQWDSMDGYLKALRSHYRYKYRKNLKQSSDLQIKKIKSKEFSQEHYRLYENVYEQTDLKINKATLEFFKSGYSHIIVANTPQKCVGFVQLLHNGDELIFSLIGMDYNFKPEYNLYLRLLLEVISYGIVHGFKTIDLGQTTYDTKRKLGADIEELYIQVNHNNKLLLRIMELFRNVLLLRHDYSKSYHVFKNERSTS